MSDFQTTNWNLVAAASGSTIEARPALAKLFEAYWAPVYGYVRRRGHDLDRSRDLVQSFFTHLLENRDDLAGVDPRRGRFRAWLLGVLQNFLANEWRHVHTLKRGGDIVFLSIDALTAEDCYARVPADTVTPERLYDRRWALAVLERVLERLEREHAAEDERERFQHLKGFLVGDEPSYEVLVGQLGQEAGTLRVQVHRLRRRYRRLLRAEIENTVQRPADVEAELRHLLDALT